MAERNHITIKYGDRKIGAEVPKGLTIAQLRQYMQDLTGIGIPDGGCGRIIRETEFSESFQTVLTRIAHGPLQDGDVIILSPNEPIDLDFS